DMATPSIPMIGWLALGLLPLLFPLASVVQWQRLATLVQNRASYEENPARWLELLLNVFRIQSIETSLLWMFIAAMGAIAVAALDLASGPGNALRALAQEATSGDNPIAAIAFSLLLMAVAALALAAMAASFSGAFCTLRYDV